MVPLGSRTNSKILTLRLASSTSGRVRFSRSLTVLMDWKGKSGHRRLRKSGCQQ